MTAMLAALGARTVGYLAAGATGLLGLIGLAWSIKRTGATDQRAEDAARGLNDAVAASKARSQVDGMGDAAVDSELRGYERK